MRKRTQLLNMFPLGTITAEQASEALRFCQGDVGQAKAALLMETKTTNKANKANMEEANSEPQAKVSTGSKSRESRIQKGNEKDKQNNSSSSSNDAQNPPEQPLPPIPARLPPQHTAAINNLSDRQYCCVWWVEAYEDGYRPDIARSLLARVARHVNPILRDRGWRVKRLLESASPKFLGCCTSNGRSDADAASANIQLNLRVKPNKHCQQFRTFPQLLSVMLHEITHISIGLEDIHPPVFYELMDEIKGEYAANLAEGKVAAETDDYKCKTAYIAKDGHVSTIDEAAATALNHPDTTLGGGTEEWCGAGKQKRRYRGRGGRGNKRSSAQAMGIQASQQQQKRRPLKKGTKMIDKRTKAGKATVAALQSLTPRELAARAALERLGGGATTSNDDNDQGGNANATAGARGTEKHKASSSPGSSSNENENENENDDYDDDIEVIEDHPVACGCRCCEWDKKLFEPSSLPTLKDRASWL